jgi:ribosomal protein S18 acetylase RimI-like enzyme
MKFMLQSLREELVPATKDLIAEVVLEFYGDLEYLPKSKPELLFHYERIGYLRDLDAFETEYSKENGAFLVATEGDEVIGCGGLRRLNPNDGELVRLWLKKEKRKQGIGRMIFDMLIRAAQEKGYAKVYLDTSHRCAHAVALFRKNGFVDCDKYKESIGELFLCRNLEAGALK